MQLSVVIYTLLHQNTDIANRVGTKIYPDVLIHNHSLPAITYTVDNIIPTEHKQSDDDYDYADVSITIYDDDRGSTEALAKYARAAMSYKSQTIDDTVVFTTGMTGMSWGYWDRQDSPGSSGMGQVVFTITINFRIQFKYTG